MRYVYLDNFRGFQEALIPLLRVNFCVGENSSGKTSFLSAVNLLSSGRFWFLQDFSEEETSFRNFTDYVSVNSKNQNNFRMGIAETGAPTTKNDSKTNEQPEARAFLFKYTEKSGLPALECCTANFKTKAITVYFSGADIKYRVTDLRSAHILESVENGLFGEWTKLQDQSQTSDLGIIKDTALKRGFLPPLSALSLAFSQASNTNPKPESSKDVLFPVPAFGGNTAWIAPIRTKPRRTYDEVRLQFSPEGGHMPYTIKKILAGGRRAQEFTRFIEKLGKESGLFRSIKVHKFGRSASSPFELEVVLDSKPINISNVGYGVSQVLPVIVESFVRPNGTMFAIQQPEVHLHPRAQASIGEMIFLLALIEKKNFVVETHSDFTIDRFRMCLKESRRKIKSQVLFFQRNNGRNISTPIPIEDDGELAKTQPDSYREFFLKEQFRIIGI